MDFNQVRFFLAVSDTLNFTRAAELCNVTQPALTQSIKRLESELGGELIRRDGRNTDLTPLGRSLRSHFQQIDRTKKLISSTAKAVGSGEQSELNIGLMCTIGPMVLSDPLKQFQAKYPKITIVLHDVTPSSITDLLLSGAIDAAFCAQQDFQHPRVKYSNLFPESMVVAFANNHPFIKMSEVSLKAIADERYVDRLHCEFREIFMMYCAEANLELDVVFCSQREDWLQNLIREGLGVGVIPQYSLLYPTLDFRPISDSGMHRNIYFSYLDESESTPGLNLLVEQIETYDWSSITA